MRARAVAVPLSPQLTVQALCRYLQDARPLVLITDSAHLATCQQALVSANLGTRLLVTRSWHRCDPEQPDNVDERDPAASGFGESDVATSLIGDRALYLYSSGSQGAPKRVCRTRANLLYEARNFAESAGLTAEDTILCLVPLHHSYGLGNGLLAALHAGATLVCLEPEEDSRPPAPFASRCGEVLALIQQHSVRVVVAVSAQYAALAELAAAEADAFRQVRLCLSSGGPLSRDVYDRFLQRYGVPIRTLYGSTETGSIAVDLAPSVNHGADSVGPPLSRVQVLILAADGSELPVGTEGLIAVRSPVLPPGGYDVRPDGDAGGFCDGMYITGDLGRLDARGCLFLTGRKTAFISTGGYKVDPAEVEEALRTHPDVSDVAVVGVAAQDIEELVKAVVVLRRPADSFNPQALAHYCATRLASYQIPQVFELRPELPRGALGKLLKEELRRPYAPAPAGSISTGPDGAAPADGAPPALELGIDRSGWLDHLTWRRSERREPGPDEVVISVQAAGLNFVDVLSALGLVPDDAPGAESSGPRLGSECCGHVLAIGAGVTSVSVGDEVVAVTTGCLRSHVVVPQALVVRKPSRLSALEAVTLPVAYLTAAFALVRTARLVRGERVLIHAASGAVGQVAIQLAQELGAEVFATAGSEAKRDAVRALGVSNVFDSRSLDFARQVRTATRGEGVDVVLNSLGGGFIEASVGVLRELGRFVELGKRDYYADRPFGLRPFLHGLQFSLVDLRRLLWLRPLWVQELLVEMRERVERGMVRPVPGRVYPALAAKEAFREMAAARHTGKIVLDLSTLTSPAAKELLAGAPPKDSALRVRLLGLPPRERQAVLLQHVREDVAAIVRLAASEVSPDQPFRSLGLDSLLAVELSNRLNASLQLGLSITALWSYPTIRELVEAALRAINGPNPAELPPVPKTASSRLPSDTPRPLPDVITEIEHLSDAEISERLRPQHKQPAARRTLREPT